MFRKYIRLYVTLVVICFAVLTHTGRSEAYSVATYSGGSTEWGKFAVDRSGKIYWASYFHYCNPENTRLNLHYSNGNSGLTWITGTDSIGGHGVSTTVGSYVIDANNIHWIAVNATQNGYYWSALYKYDGSTLSKVLDNQGVLRALGISPSDGSVWMAGTGSYNGLYRWNGSWFEYKTTPGWEISAFGADYGNNFWAAGPEDKPPSGMVLPGQAKGQYLGALPFINCWSIPPPGVCAPLLRAACTSTTAAAGYI
ncbi:MAG: hypothetical protein M1130_03890 [Actinobacteria bacterium]|nr:hypothetical protein [Actinomycetota bacterium]